MFKGKDGKTPPSSTVRGRRTFGRIPPSSVKASHASCFSSLPLVHGFTIQCGQFWAGFRSCYEVEGGPNLATLHSSADETNKKKGRRARRNRQVNERQRKKTAGAGNCPPAIIFSNGTKFQLLRISLRGKSRRQW